jgi:hypothetical protein
MPFISHPLFRKGEKKLSLEMEPDTLTLHLSFLMASQYAQVRPHTPLPAWDVEFLAVQGARTGEWVEAVGWKAKELERAWQRV